VRGAENVYLALKRWAKKCVALKGLGFVSHAYPGLCFAPSRAVITRPLGSEELTADS